MCGVVWRCNGVTYFATVLPPAPVLANLFTPSSTISLSLCNMCATAEAMHLTLSSSLSRRTSTPSASPSQDKHCVDIDSISFFTPVSNPQAPQTSTPPRSRPCSHVQPNATSMACDPTSRWPHSQAPPPMHKESGRRETIARPS